MSTLTDNDVFLIQQNGETKTVLNKNRSTLDPDNDVFLVQRSGVTHTIKAGDVGGGGGELTQVNLAPLSGTPEFVVTATTDLSEILPESTINYQWYRYTASTGGTGMLLQELTSDSAILDTYETTAADQGSYIGCTVTYLGTTVTETERTQCLTAPGPVATMHGLRFDGDRETGLLSKIDSDINSFTVSAWVKYTSTGPNKIIEIGDKGSDYFEIRTQNNAITTNSVVGGGGTSLTLTSTAVPNRWYHVVVSRTATEFKGYLDGGSAITSSGNTHQITSGEKIALGLNCANANNLNTSSCNGYLSEVYFVEEVLPPTAFGKNFEPYGWGPLDSTQIIENIGGDKASFGANGFYLPFDPEATNFSVFDYAQYSYPGDSAYGQWPVVVNGNIPPDHTDTYGNEFIQSSYPGQIQPSIYFTEPITGLVEVYASTSGGQYSSGGKVILADIDNTALSTYVLSVNNEPPESPRWISLGSVENAARIRFDRGGDVSARVRLSAIRVNGELLYDYDNIGVDASGNENNFLDQNFAVGNTSQVWSNSTTASFIATGRSVKDIFNGTLNTGLYPYQGKTAYINFDNFPLGQYELYFRNTDPDELTSSGLISVNDVAFPSPTYRWLPVSGEQLNTMVLVSHNSPTRYTELLGIRLNGVLLVDPNQQDTVTDTPLRDYAVLDPNQVQGTTTLTNGNLQCTTGSGSRVGTTIPMLSGKYYFEATNLTAETQLRIHEFNNITGDYIQWSDLGSSRVVGVTCDADTGSFTNYLDGIVGTTQTFARPASGYMPGQSGNGGFATYNFGQQPFVASNVIYDQETGIVEIPNDLSPYDTRANTDQVWSAGGVTGATTPAQYLFDGDSSTFVNNNASDPPTQVVVTLSAQIPVNTSLRFYGNVESSAPPEYFIEATYSDDTTERLVTSSTGFGWYEIIGAAGKTLKSFNWTGSTSGAGGSTNNYWGQVEVDGRLLVDQDVWNNSQNWSAGAVDMNNAGNAFDGSINTSSLGIATGTNSTASVNFTGISVIDTVQVYTGSNRSARVNSGTWKSNNGTEGYLTFSLTGDLNTIELRYDGVNASPANLHQVVVDGAILVDSGEQWNTSQVWSDGAYVGTESIRATNPISNAFDGNPSTECEGNAVTTGSTGDVLGSFTLPSPVSVTNTVSVRVGGSANYRGVYINDDSGNTLEADGSNGLLTFNFTGDLEKISVVIGSLYGGPVFSPFPSFRFGEIIVDGVLLVDPTGGTFSTLFQTWEQTKVTLLKARAEGDEARISELEAILVRQAVPFDRDTKYPKGTIVNMRGQLFEALVDEADVSLETFVSPFFRQTIPEWENLNIKTTYEKKQSSRSKVQ